MKQSDQGAGWLKPMVRINPFFVASSLMVLAGIALALNNDAFLESNESSLAFSLSSIEFYEVCLIVGSVWLAKRLIYKDSLMLLVIEFIFLVIPFILINPALQSGDPLNPVNYHAAAVKGATIVGVLAVALVVLRMTFLTKGYPNLRIGYRFFVIIGLVLGVNLIAPLLLFFLFDPEKAMSKERYELLKPMFYFALPVLAALVNLLPRPTEPQPTQPQRQPWMPQKL